MLHVLLIAVVGAHATTTVCDQQLSNILHDTVMEMRVVVNDQVMGARAVVRPSRGSRT